MAQLTKVKENIPKIYRQIMQPKNTRPNWTVWTVFVNCAHWRGSTLAIWNSSDNIPS